MSANDHRDARLPADERADLLARQMTTVEKAWQLNSVPAWWISTGDGTDPEGLDELLTRAPGHVSNFGLDDPRQMADAVGRIQRVAIERTRLGVPLLFHAEALNGFLCGGHRVFPTPIGLGATWSPDLVGQMADVIRRQMVRVGVRQALSPVLDVALDPRWGRVHETYGEDPFLVAALGVAYVRGLQGEDLRDGVIATAKHFLAYGLPQGGLNLSAVQIGQRQLRDVYAVPFAAAIQAGLGSVMNSYSEVDGVPVPASRELFTDLLRGELGFDGFTSADYSTLEHLVTRLRVAADPAEAGRAALSAGLDVENPVPYGYGDVLAEQVERGVIDKDLLEISVRRVLRAKLRLGLFEHPYPAERIDLDAVAGEGRGLATELARRSVVLASNDGILPLAGRGLSVAVVGPHADAVGLQFPTYTYPAFREMTLFMSSGGLGNMVGADPGMAAWNSTLLPPRSTEEFVRAQQGATSLVDEVARRAERVVAAPGATLTEDLGEDELARAVTAATQADVVVLALGGASLWFGGERTEGEASDSADVALPAAQVRLAEAVAATGTPMVVVLVQGRAYTLPPAVTGAAAVLIAPYAGAGGPAAVADVLFGEVSPSGKLPYSIPRHGGQVPVYHYQKAGSGQRMGLPPGVDHHYLDLSATPLWPFGHGLSYSTFELSGLDCPDSVTTDGSAAVSLTVRNTGDREAATVVQLYARVNTTTAVTRPAQQLVGFARLALAAGAAGRVTFTIDATQFGYTDMDYRFAVDPARVDVFAGLDSNDRSLEGAFDLVGPTRVVPAAERAFLAQVSVDD